MASVRSSESNAWRDTRTRGTPTRSSAATSDCTPTAAPFSFRPTAGRQHTTVGDATAGDPSPGTSTTTAREPGLRRGEVRCQGLLELCRVHASPLQVATVEAQGPFDQVTELTTDGSAAFDHAAFRPNDPDTQRLHPFDTADERERRHSRR